MTHGESHSTDLTRCSDYQIAPRVAAPAACSVRTHTVSRAERRDGLQRPEIKGQRILITGGTGSFGKVLATACCSPEEMKRRCVRRLFALCCVILNQAKSSCSREMSSSNSSRCGSSLEGRQLLRLVVIGQCPSKGISGKAQACQVYHR